MTSQHKPRLFETERKETDDSLHAEREKATESLNSASSRSQGRTDEIMKDERSIADQTTASTRADHDEAHRTDPAQKTAPQAQSQVLEERRRADLATGLERSRMDQAILTERAHASRIVNAVLDEERRATDHNLAVERDSADANHVGSSRLLRSERAAHNETKVSLTSRDEFLAIVSHDLKNPIGAITSYAGLILEDDEAKNLNPEFFGFIKAIKRNADLSLRLISDLLDVERISQNKLELRFGTFSVRKIVQAAYEIFSPSASEKKISLVLHLTDNDTKVKCDRDRLLQALSNLIGNALKYTPAGGTVSVSIAKRDDSVVVSVEDTGVGIPKERQLEIFERFAQLKSNDRTGLGLGLYIAKTLIEAHDGNFWISSEPGFGSTFSFSLPAR